MPPFCQRPFIRAGAVTELNLDGTSISDAGFLKLKALPNLTAVHVRDTQVSSAAANELKAALPSVRISRGRALQYAKIEPLPVANQPKQ